MPRNSTKPRRPSKPRRRTRRRTTPTARPSARDWTMLLEAFDGLRAEIQRLAEASSLSGAGSARRLDWAQFKDSRAAAAAGRERYWRDAGAKASAR